MTTLRRLVQCVLGGGQPDPDKIRIGVLGALGQIVDPLNAGGTADLVWLDAGGGKVGCRVRVRGADGKLHLSLFQGQGAGRHAAAMVVWVMVGSAVGHSEGTQWAGAARRLRDGVEAGLRAEGIL